MSQTLSPDLTSTFKETLESSPSPPKIRALLARSENNKLNLISTFNASSSDRDDFQPCLKQLLSQDKDRSGYVLFRLDTQSASGEWEWICLAYQPDGAKIREKMNYVPVRTSLLSSLGERNFLATEFGSTPTEFQYPTKLRNARKHDYQNPQLKTAGKKASEAAGTDAGGARRNFGAAAAATVDVGRRYEPTKPVVEEKKEERKVEAAPPAQEPVATTTPASVEEPQPVVSNVEPEPEATQVLVQSFQEESLRSTLRTDESAPAQTFDGESHPSESEASEKPDQQAQEVGPEGASTLEDVEEVTLDNQSTEESQVEGLKVEEPLNEAEEEKKQEEQAGGEELVTENSTPLSPETTTMPTQEEAELKGPEEPPTPATIGNVNSNSEDETADQASKTELIEQELSHPTLPEESQVQEVAEEVAVSRAEETSTSVPSSVIDPIQEQIDPPTTLPTPSRPSPITSTSSQPPPQSTSTIGIGKSSNSLLSSSEQALQTLKANEASSLASISSIRPSGTSSGSSSLGFGWSEEVEPALAGLATHVSGSAEWNFVSISINFKDETLELSEPPRFLPLADIAESVERGEPRFVLYRMEDTSLGKIEGLDQRLVEEVSKGQSPVVFIYSCPGTSSIKSKMLYSANRNLLLAKIQKDLSKLWIAAKIETSDPSSDLTASTINSDLAFSIRSLISKNQSENIASNGAVGKEGGAISGSNHSGSGAKAFSRPRRPGAR